MQSREKAKKQMLWGAIFFCVAGVLWLVSNGMDTEWEGGANESSSATTSGVGDVPLKEVVDEEGVRHVPTLDMSNWGADAVPMNVFDHTELVVLNLSHNNLTGALQAEVRHLQNLEELDLSYNQFTGVPAEIGQLSKLRRLDLSYNQLTGLPYELGNLQNLETLVLTGNDYAEQDLANIKDALPSTVEIVL